VVRCVDEVLKIYGGVDILVNNAGIGSSGRHLFDQTLDEWERVIAVNLTGPYIFSKHASRIMASRGGGVIINIASTRALQSEPNTEAYSASKGGLLALTHALAMSLSRYRISVVSISPGWVDTSRWVYPLVPRWLLIVIGINLFWIVLLLDPQGCNNIPVVIEGLPPPP
jgi:NAD(P)-dependent dehydrogenase (short-subunit alcohol dehydrogenase family)